MLVGALEKRRMPQATADYKPLSGRNPGVSGGLRVTQARPVRGGILYPPAAIRRCGRSATWPPYLSTVQWAVAGALIQVAIGPPVPIAPPTRYPLPGMGKRPRSQAGPPMTLIAWPRMALPRSPSGHIGESCSITSTSDYTSVRGVRWAVEAGGMVLQRKQVVPMSDPYFKAIEEHWPNGLALRRARRGGRPDGRARRSPSPRPGTDDHGGGQGLAGVVGVPEGEGPWLSP
jgi:hypothetical protein